MARVRDYQAEYKRREQLAQERGLTKSQQRGHAKPGETPVSQLPETVRTKGYKNPPRKAPKNALPSGKGTTVSGVRYHFIEGKTVPQVGGAKVQYYVYGTSTRLRLTPDEALDVAQSIIDAERNGYTVCRISLLGKLPRYDELRSITGPNASVLGSAAVTITRPYANRFTTIKGVQVIFKKVTPRR